MSSIEKYAKLAEKVDLFQGLNGDEVRAIIKLGDRQSLPNNQPIFHEGHLATNFFVVLQGEVHLYIKAKLIAKCRAGDTFGAMEALTHAPHSSTAVTHGKTKVFVMKEKDIGERMNQGAAVRLLLNAIHILSLQLEQAFSHHLRLKRELARRDADDDLIPSEMDA